MAWQNTFTYLIWPVVYEDHVVDEALLGRCAGAGLAFLAFLSTGRQVQAKVFESSFGLQVKGVINRFVTNAHVFISGVVDGQAIRNLLR